MANAWHGFQVPVTHLATYRTHATHMPSSAMRPELHSESETGTDLTLVVPVYNESESLPLFIDRTTRSLAALGLSYEIIFVDDGSKDNSLQLLIGAAQRDPRVRVLEFSRNFGKEAALTAGLDAATGKAVIPIDADLQHPPEIIQSMVALWHEGFDVVLGCRASRENDRPIQRRLAHLFYKVHNRLADCRIPPDVGDFRLMDRCVVEAIKLLPERRRFMKGIFAWVGFRTTTVYFDVAPRQSGSTSFSTWQLWNFALDGILGFSTLPLRIWTYAGSAVATGALVYAITIVLKTLLAGTDLPGYPSLFSAILFFGGVQLIGIGVLGEYIGRIHSEVKGRPIYIVRKRYGQHD